MYLHEEDVILKVGSWKNRDGDQNVSRALLTITEPLLDIQSTVFEGIGKFIEFLPSLSDRTKRYC